MVWVPPCQQFCSLSAACLALRMAPAGDTNEDENTDRNEGVCQARSSAASLLHVLHPEWRLQAKKQSYPKE